MNTYENAKEIYLAGGCFWGIDAYLRMLPGILSTEVGYANGTTENPTYEQVCQGNTGYAETVHVIYQPEKLSLSTLLEAYFQVIDPISKNKQGNDRGVQYRTGIYYFDTESLQEIQTVIEIEQKKYIQPIQVEVLALQNYSTAEEYHQNYLEKNPGGYCHINLDKAKPFIEKGKLEQDNLSKKIKVKTYEIPTPQELKAKLTDIQYRVTQNKETERPFTSEYTSNVEQGIYVDIVTGEPLFTSLDQFDSGCGWPSFSKPIAREVIIEDQDTNFNMLRTEVHSRSGGSHLGHVFDDGPQEKGGLRYCINGASLRFIHKDQLEKEGYGFLKSLFESL